MRNLFSVIKLKYHNDRVKAKTKKGNKDLDKLEKSRDAEGNPVGDVDIDKLNARIDKNATKLDYHADKYKEIHDRKYEKLARKILHKPGELEKIIRDPRHLRHIPNPSLFTAQVENIAKSDTETIDRLVKTTSKHRDDVARHTKQLKQAGGTLEYNENPNVETKLKELDKKADSLINSIIHLIDLGKRGSSGYKRAVSKLIKIYKKREKHEKHKDNSVIVMLREELNSRRK